MPFVNIYGSHHFPQKLFSNIRRRGVNTWFSNFRQWEIYELPPDEICPIKFSQWDPAVEAAYALFNAFEFSRKISLNVIWKNVKDDGSRTRFVITFYVFDFFNAFKQEILISFPISIKIE